MTTKAIKEDRRTGVVLGEEPFVHPGNLSIRDFSKYLHDLSGRIAMVAELQADSARYQEAAPAARRRFEAAKDELLAEEPLLSLAITLFPESQAAASYASEPNTDLSRANLSVNEQGQCIQGFSKPVNGIRSPTQAEIETLQAVISSQLAELWNEGQGPLTATAVLVAAAVRGAFEELYRPATPIVAPDFSD